FTTNDVSTVYFRTSSTCSRYNSIIFFLLFHRPSRSTLFPYTTLFRSKIVRRLARRPPLPYSGPFNLFLYLKKYSLMDVRRNYSRSEEHTSELQSRENLVCRLLLEKKKKFFMNQKKNILSNLSPTLTRI